MDDSTDPRERDRGPESAVATPQQSADPPRPLPLPLPFPLPLPLPPRFSREDLSRCIEVLEALAEDRTGFVHIGDEDRVRLLMAAGRVSRPHRHEMVRASKAFRRVERHQRQTSDREARASTEIRTARRAAVYAAPAQIVGSGLGGSFAPPQSGIGGSSAPPQAPQRDGRDGRAEREERGEQERSNARELTTPRKCYVCKDEFTRLHFFYDAMCAPCAELNYAKRFQSAPLHGKVALITGARLKIGYQASLMMLRAGAHVIATTRFPHDAAARYAREDDYDAWKDRLAVHGLDLRHAPSVEIFARYLLHTESRLDILINNAAQTVRRPPAFYAHLLELEARAIASLDDRARGLLRGYADCKQALSIGEALPAHAPGLESSMGLAAWPQAQPGIGILAPAELSQIPCAFDAALAARDVFPEGRLDADLQQVDLRAMNSWRMTLADVPTPELLEVHLVNAVAPFILCSKLKALMMRGDARDRHIVNVSAMEGKFARHVKTDKHPHTNMAKAALNMMTLTSAPDYVKHGIHMNAVDTGWVTDEDPAQIAARKQIEHDFQPPLDIVDGAARVCDPFFSGILRGEHVWGKFLKDYAPTSW